MNLRTLHRLAGAVLLVPLLGWAITGAIFFLKAGYAGAYEILQVKTYPLNAGMQFQSDPAWLEARLMKSVLGQHLLVHTAAGWRHLDPHSLQPKPRPSEQELRALLNDAFTANPTRYGQIVSVRDAAVTTNTGVRVSLNWERMTLAQQGKDTGRIDRLYKIHYLQWTGIPSLDKVLGATGIALILVLSLLGARLMVAGK